MRILIVEDDIDLSTAVACQLKNDGYDVDVCDNGEDALYYIEGDAYDVVILDRMLPGKDGLSILQNVRGNGIVTPIIMVTAMNGLGDRVGGLDAGADDYIAKPFEMVELKARIRALLRRPRNIDDKESIEYGNIALKSKEMMLYRTDISREVELSKKENTLLELFFKNTGHTVTREQIILKLWGPDAFVEDGNVDTYIHFVRRRLKVLECNVKIKTVHGVGYKFELM